MIRLGTSGFSYDDWVGSFYAEDLPRWQWLSFYAQQFDTVELNVTYYRLPEAKVVRGWVERTPDDFLFTLKAHKSLTHEREIAACMGFCESIDAMLQSGKLACILLQFPHSFHPTMENREYLNQLREGLQGYPLAAEFRGNDWVSEETFAQLTSLNLGFCCVDEPQISGLMPPLAIQTGPLGYVRFHGRNAEKWWQHEHAWERYDYTYSEEELKEWVPKIRDLDQQAPLTLVYANNHYRSQSIDAIRKLQYLLGWEEGT